MINVALLEKEAVENAGLSADEVISLANFLRGDKDDVSLIPIELDGASSSAMGFITADAEEVFFSHHTEKELRDFIFEILSDVEKENVSHIYTLDNLTIWLGRTIRDFVQISIPLGDGKRLVAERGLDSVYHEIYVYLQNQNVCVQDLAIVRQAYQYGQKAGEIQHENAYEVLVYGDSEDEDFTNRFRIEEYENKE